MKNLYVMGSFKSIISKFFICLCVGISFTTLYGQKKSFYEKSLTYIFDSDSLLGFDELEITKQVSLLGYEGQELKWVLFTQKRNYINNKYKLTSSLNDNDVTNTTNKNLVSKQNTLLSAPCVNEDFEASPVGQVVGNTLAGWTVGSMFNTWPNGAACNNLATTAAGSPECWIVTTPIADPNIGVIPNSPLGGTKVIQLQNNNIGSLCTKISQTFPVTPSNALFQFAYAGAWNGSGHACCDQPSFNVRIKDCTGNVLACPAVSLTPSGLVCTSGVTGYTVTGGISWTNWVIRSLDLTPFLNSCVTIEVTVSDCNGGAHQGYAYFDAICKPMTVQINNVLFPAGTSSINVNSCGVSTATMYAPVGLGPYNWNGPAGSSITNATTQIIQSNVSGNYTLTMTPPGSCLPIVVKMNLQFGPTPNANFTNNSSCNTFTFNNVGNPSPAVQTYLFIGSSAPPSFTTAATSTAVAFPVGTYTVIHSINASGCVDTVKSTITVLPPPSAAFAIPSTTQCLVGNSYNFNAAINSGTHSYTFSPIIGSPANGSSPNYGPVSFTSPGTYTVTHTINNGCIVTTNSVITINPQPSLSINSINATCGNNNGSIVLNNTSSVGQTVMSYSLNGAAIASQTVTNLAPASYTVGLTNNFGCVTNYPSSILNTAGVTNLATTITNPSCGNSNGSIVLGTVTGGTAPYTFNINGGPFSTSPTLNTLSAGSYTIIVKDANNCTFTKLVTLLNLAGPTAITYTTFPTVCVGNTGAVGITGVTGGLPAYTYSINGIATNTLTSNLPAGTQTISVNDANGCAYTTTVNVPVLVGPSNATIAVTDAACGNANGSATVTAVSGGVPSYQYAFNNGAFSSNLSFGGMLAGPKSVIIKDANSCTLTVNFIVGNTGSPTSAIATQTNVSCYNGANGGFSVSSTGGTPGYSYTLTPGNATSGFGIFTGLIAQSYTINVTDALGCVSTVTTSISQPNAISLSVTSIPPTCNGGSNGTITASGSGGTSPYVFNVNGGANQAANTFTNAIFAGAYNVTVIDNLGCTISQTINVNQPPAITLTLASSPANCSASNGSATVVANGGTLAYSYTWFPLGGNNAQATNVAANNYTVIVKDVQSCTVTGVVTVSATPGGTAVITNTNNVTCFGMANGSLTANMAGNFTAPLTYSWTTGSLLQTAGPLAPGNYTVTVTDFYGCKSNAIGTITQPSALSLVSSGSPASCNGGATGSASVLASGGTPGYSYLWSPNGSTTSVTSGLFSGTYTVVVTDANSCQQFQTVNIAQPTSLTINTSTVTANCNQANGAATAIASGGTPSYTYTWSTGFVGQTLSNVSAGTYSIQIADANGCIYTSAATIPNASGPIIAISGFTNPSCYGGNNGAATTTVISGGATGNGFPIYNWSNGQNTGSATNLLHGIYSVTLTDAAGCIASASVSITQPSSLTLNIAGTNPKCYNATNGSANIGVIGGTSPYSYSWLPAPGSGSITSSPSNMGPGNYNVTITDSKGCIAQSSILLQNPAQMLSSVTKTNISCYNVCNGIAVGNASNSFGNVSYYWTGGGVPLTTQTVTNLCAGNYTLLATDQNLCTATTVFNITQPPLLTVSISAIGSPSCAGYNNGFATANVSGGTPGYTYVWSNAQTAATSNNLAAGNYTITVTDSKFCSASAVATITQPQILTAIATKTNVTCYGLPNGIGNINYSGGTGIPSFLWQPNLAITNYVNNLTPNTYTVTLKDLNNCSVSVTLNITQPSALVANITTVVPTNCGQANGSASVSVSGGAGGYSYLWSSNPNFTFPSINNVPAQAYSVTVTDANNCSVTTATIVPNISSPNVVVTNTQAVSCYGLSNGGATITTNGGAGGNTYLWSYLAQTTQNVNNLPFGLHSVIVTDAAGCINGAIVSITQPAQLITAVGSVTNVLCSGQSSGGAQILTVGGTPGYNYSWSPTSQNNSLLSGVSSGTYVCTVTDANGCVSSKSLSISHPNPLIITTNTVVPNNCNGFANGQINTSITGGTPTYNIVWIPSQPSNPNITNLIAGSYSLAISDSKGCVTNTVYTLVDPTALSILATNTTQAKCGNMNGTASVLIGGGSPTYFYNWNTANPQLVANANGLSPGTWSVTVTDSKGCIIVGAVNITAATLPSVTAVSNSISCFGQSSGGATLTASGVGGYTYNWLPTGLTSASINGVGPAIHSATITDANGCKTYTSVIIIQPNVLTLNVSPTQTICFGNNATIYGQGSGGTVPYNYTLTNLINNVSTSSLTSNGISVVSTLTTTANYSVALVDANGCAYGPISIAVNVKPPLVASGKSYTSCASDFVMLKPNITAVGNGGPYSYAWSDFKTSPIDTILSNYPITNPQVYSVTISDGCTLPNATASFSLTVYPVPNGSFTPIQNKGCAPLTVKYTAFGDSTTTNANPFVWQIEGQSDTANHYLNSQTVTYTNSGVYSLALIIINKYGCREEINAPAVAEAYPVPIANFFPDRDSTTLMEPTINFSNVSTGATSYIWDFGDYSYPTTNTSFSLNPNHQYSYIGSYKVYLIASNDHGCKDTAMNNIEVIPDMAIYIPNAFTPDGNKRNDVFLPYGYGIDPEKYKMEIFDRWGELIFSSNEFNIGWDGKVKSTNTIARDGVYIYKIYITDFENNKRAYIGYVTLLSKQ